MPPGNSAPEWRRSARICSISRASPCTTPGAVPSAVTAARPPTETTCSPRARLRNVIVSCAGSSRSAPWTHSMIVAWLSTAPCRSAAARSRLRIVPGVARREPTSSTAPRGSGAVSLAPDPSQRKGASVAPRASACRCTSPSMPESNTTGVPRSMSALMTRCSACCIETVPSTSSGPASRPQDGSTLVRSSSTKRASSESPPVVPQRSRSCLENDSRKASRQPSIGSSSGSMQPSMNGCGYCSQFGGTRKPGSSFGAEPRSPGAAARRKPRRPVVTRSTGALAGT